MYMLPESLTMHNVRLIQDELIRFLEQALGKDGENGKEATLDCRNLVDLDMAGLQLLLSAAKSFYQNEMPLNITNVQPPIQELLQLTGAEEIINPEGHTKNFT